MTIHWRALPAIGELLEAFRLAGPGYLVRHVALTLIAGILVFVTNAIFAAPDDGFATTLGIGLLVLMLASVITMQFQLALDRALDFPPSLQSALTAIPRAPLIAVLALSLWVTGSFLTGFIGSLALPIVVLIARLPLTYPAMGCVDTRRPPRDFVAHFVRTMYEDGPRLVIVATFAALLTTVGVLSVAGWLYLHPLSTLLIAVAYRDSFQIESA